MRGVILHGGYGTKLRPLTYSYPKQLLPIANKPISQYVLENLKKAGILDIALILGNIYPEKVKDHYGTGEKFGVKIHYIQQEQPRGIAQAVSLCKKFVDNDPFVLYLGDNLLQGDINQLYKKFKNSNSDALLLLCEVNNPSQFGIAKFNHSGKLVQLVEKPKDPPSNFAVTGIYFFKPVIFDFINKLKPSWRGELEITDAIHSMLESGYNVKYEKVKGWWKDTGTPNDFLEANGLILEDLLPNNEGLVEDIDSVRGNVSIGKNSVIKKKASIKGPAIIGENTVIEKDVCVGSYSSIGNNCKINKGEIENSIIMDNCIIDANIKITNSLIGPFSNISSSSYHLLGKKFILAERSSIKL